MKEDTFLSSLDRYYAANESMPSKAEIAKIILNMEPLKWNGAQGEISLLKLNVFKSLFI
ncbi:hypothetical protein [Sphingobacterium puteale]|uniref:hypothetical protein n=1 Tax=Sphingobacterium puteale TaxID=2420510 RepID=UPI003D952500